MQHTSNVTFHGPVTGNVRMGNGNDHVTQNAGGRGVTWDTDTSGGIDPADGFVVGAYASGDCVSLGSRKVGRIVAVHRGATVTLVEVVDTDDRKHTVERVKLVDPVGAAGDATADAILRGLAPEQTAERARAAAQSAGAGQHLSAKLAAAALEAARVVVTATGPGTPYATAMGTAYTAQAAGSDPHTIGITALHAARAAGATDLEAAAIGSEARTKAEQRVPLVA